MKYLLENEHAKKIDEFSINTLGIPSIVLMENAARSSAEFIFSKININDRILCLCGVGNNGGDGLAIARHLFNLGVSKIEVYVVGNISKQTNDNRVNLDILKSLGFEIKYINDVVGTVNIGKEFEVIIDALIGLGAKKELKGLFPKLLKNINNYKGLKFAIDLPTGLDSNTGLADENAFVADYTITMFSPKIGLLINDGKKIAGKIIEAYLGVPQTLLKQFSKNYILEIEDLKYLLPARREESNKFDFGRILIVAGSDRYSGAAALSSNACIKSGAGLVELFSNKFHSSLFPEIIQLQGIANKNGSLAYDNIKYLNENLIKYDVIAIGPGLTNDNESIKLTQEIIYNNNHKIIIDADGLKAIIPNKELSPRILITPHIYEFINTFNLDRIEVLKNPYDYAKIIAKEYNCNVLLKGVPSIITNGIESYYNIIGNSGMSTAGSGDVLTGILAYYAAMTENVLLAGAMGALVHSTAGDIYARKYNMESLTASELINSLKEIKIG